MNPALFEDMLNDVDRGYVVCHKTTKHFVIRVKLSKWWPGSRRERE